VYEILVGKSERKKQLGKPRRRWENNIKMNLEEMGLEGEYWINLAQNTDRLWALVNRKMNF
jgi:hypothetical protein